MESQQQHCLCSGSPVCFPRLDPEGFPHWLLGDGVLLPTELRTALLVFEMGSAKQFYVREPLRN